ncbi:Firmicu-CTERM sorting domain-containing protein [Lacticaseibacillus jixiensis]|uniref:Firmicu-CTERM sorting domain-containing protein n=1 Tax=Lacticaseibacillus jixiensis TaxID=3231926 RepID=UPI0036F3D65C
MKLHHLLLAAAALAIGAVFAFPQHATQAATSVTIDGQYGDWAQYPAAKVGYSEDAMNLVKIAADTQHIDIYIQAHGNQRNNAIPNWQYTLQVGNHTYYQINLGNGDTIAQGSATVYSAQTPVGTAQITRSKADGNYKTDYSTVEMQLDLSKLGASDTKVGDAISFNLGSAGLGGQLVKTTVGSTGANTDTNAASTSSAASASSSASSSSSTSSSSNVSSNGVVTDKGDADPHGGDQNHNNDNLGLSIDGEFADWQDIQKTVLSGNKNQMAMVTQGDDVYVYVKMNPNMPMPGYGDYNFTIGGQHVFVWSNNMPQQSQLTTGGAAQAVTFYGGKWNEGNQYGTVGTGYVRQYDGGAGAYDVMEFKVSLKAFNLSNTTSQTITMENPNVGGGAVTAAGGSTGPVVLASVGVLIAGFGYYKLRRFKKTPLAAKQSTVHKDL